MKERFPRFLVCLFAFIIILGLPTPIQAAEDLTIPSWTVEAQLLNTGDLHIVEDLTYRFNNDFNGVFREIVLDKTSGVSDIRVEEIIGDSGKLYTHVAKAKKGEQGVYVVENEDETLSIKIFSPSEDEEKTFRIGYVVKNVAIKYNDVGELYYKFLGDENETPIGNFVVNLHLPGKDTSNKVRVFAHGPLNGQIEKRSENTFSLRVKDVPYNTFIEGRVIFPKEFIPLSKNMVNKNNLENILQEEDAYARQLEEKAERNRVVGASLGQASLLATTVGTMFLLFFLIIFRRERDIFRDFHPGTIPEDCTPALACYLTSSMITPNTILATFLDLFRKGYISLEEAAIGKNKSAKNQAYIICKMREPDSALLNHEKHFMDWFINKIGNGSWVTTEQIQSFNKKNSMQPHTLRARWVEQIKKDAEAKGHFDHSKRKYGVLFNILFVPLLILGISTLVYENLWGIGSILLAVLLFLYGISLLFRRSDYGYEQHKKWIAFKKYMKGSQKSASPEELMGHPQDISLIYALGLGVIKPMEEIDIHGEYSRSDFAYSHNWLLWYMLFANNNDNALSQSIDQGWGGSGSSGSSFSGGGFTGGGGGGAGGGGAGGF